MRVDSIKISNMLTFPYFDNIDNSTQIDFDRYLNILIGPNGSGKSNFVEIINQLFKRILIINYTIDELNIVRSKEKPSENRLENTIQYKPNYHNLQKNFWSNSDQKEIKIKIGLSKGDIENLIIIFNNKDELAKLYKYCQSPPAFPRIELLSVSDIKAADGLTIHLVDKPDSDHRFYSNEERYSPVEHFIAVYIKYFHLFNSLIYIGNKYESKNWPLLKNTFALIGESRNYNSITSKYSLSPSEENERNKIILQINEENSRYANTPEPAIFLYVKHRIAYLFNNFREDYTNEKSSISGLVRLKQDPFFKNIQDTLESTLNLSLEVTKDRNTMEYSFNFVGKKKPYPVDMSALSAGEKSIIHLIFAIYGYDLKDGLMIIDEPESHIHPQVQRKLLSIINKAIKDFNMQFIIVTHSGIFVDSTTIKNIYRFYKNHNDETQVVRPSISENDSTLVRFLTYTNSSKIFFANKIILVEGPTDEYFYRAFLEKMRQNKNNFEDLEILNIQGKGDFHLWRKFLDKFETLNYYIGDLDNIFSNHPPIVTQAEWIRLGNDFISRNPTIQLKTTGDPNYRNGKDFREALISDIKMNVPAEWANIKTSIKAEYPKNIYILTEGTLEDYLLLPSKGMDKVIEFCDTNFENWYQNNPLRSEVENIFNEISRSAH